MPLKLLPLNDPFSKEKLYEALDFFSRNVRYPGKIKLFKLLYYLDLMAFRRTGQTVTGLTYQAWPMGPVPAELNQEFQDPSSELHRRFDVSEHQKLEQTADVTIDTDEAHLESFTYSLTHIPGSIKSWHPIELRHLTRREKQIAALLAEVFHDAKAAEMSDVSHGKSGPWMKAKTRGKKAGVARPDIDLMEGVVAVGDKKEELPIAELKELVEEHRKLHQALR